jgi:hypothetical protein
VRIRQRNRSTYGCHSLASNGQQPSLSRFCHRKGKGRGKGAEDFAGRGGGISLRRVAWLRSWKTAWPRRRREQRGHRPSWTCQSRFCCTSSASSPTRGRGTALRWRATGSSRQSARRGRRCRYTGTRARWRSSSSRRGCVSRPSSTSTSRWCRRGATRSSPQRPPTATLRALRRPRTSCSTPTRSRSRTPPAQHEIPAHYAAGPA